MRLSKRPAWGLGLSLLAHAAVIAWLALRPASMPPRDAPAPAMQVRLVLQPVPRVQPPPISDPTPLPRARTMGAAREAKHAAPSEVQEVAGPPAPIILPAQEAPTAADTAPAPAQPDAGFEMQAARGTARAWVKGEGKGRGGADGQGTPFRPTLEERLGQGIERARRPDCRNAYAGMGLLAAIPLAASAVTGKGCKW